MDKKNISPSLSDSFPEGFALPHDISGLAPNTPILVGFSGGADSVMLLLFLLKYREDNDFPIKAVHVNHSIRGEEADRDENFSKEFCKSLGVDFEAVRVDVPALSKEKNVGIEEAARNARYKIFNDIILADSSFSSIAVAHNATDNLETVIFNMK